jgi:hypothetical protein
MKTIDIIVTLIGVLGALASFIGAYFSIRAENKAKSAAVRAESARDSIIRKQETTDLAGILFEAKKVQQVFGKYSIASNNRSLTGVEFEKDAGALQSFIFNFNENRSTISLSSDIDTQIAYNDLNTLLDDFTRSRSITDKKYTGKQIRISLDDIIFKMRKVIDNRNSEI